MTYTTANKALDEIIEDIKASRLGPLFQDYLIGLLEVVKYYTKHLYTLLPAKVEE